jgi:hypothetical protein
VPRKRLTLGFLALTTAFAPAALAAPLPRADEVALQAFYDGCLQPVSARKNPGPPMAEALASYKPDEAARLDPAHPEHRLWRVRAVDGDLELEVLGAKAWCEVRLMGADPAELARRLNISLSRMDVPLQRKSLGGEAGVMSEAVVLGHAGADDGVMLLLRQPRDPREGEPGLTLSVSPVRLDAGRQ